MTKAKKPTKKKMKILLTLVNTIRKNKGLGELSCFAQVEYQMKGLISAEKCNELIKELQPEALEIVKFKTLSRKAAKPRFKIL